jgi:(2Fe-2S) ferredoxin
LTKLGLKKICQDNDEESWKGPIVVFGVACDGEDHPTYVNVTPEDFSRVVDAGLLFGAPASQEQLEKIRKGFMNLRL